MKKRTYTFNLRTHDIVAFAERYAEHWANVATHKAKHPNYDMGDKRFITTFILSVEC